MRHHGPSSGSSSCSAKPLLIAAVVVAVLTLGGCGAVGLWLIVAPQAPASEPAARDLAEQVLPPGFTTADLRYRRELRSGDEVIGYAWRLARLLIGSRLGERRPTHIGVLTCVRGDEATGAARFSHLRWEPAGCEGGEPRLRRVQRTPEQDDEGIAGSIGRASEIELSDAVERAGAGS